MDKGKALSRLCGTCKEYNMLLKEHVKNLVETGDYNSFAGMRIVIDMAIGYGCVLNEEWKSKLAAVCRNKDCRLTSIYNMHNRWERLLEEWNGVNERVEHTGPEHTRMFLKEHYISIQKKKDGKSR